MSKLISISQNEVVIVDNKDYDLISQYKWYLLRSVRINYAIRNIKLYNGVFTQQYMHHLIVGVGTRIDHINSNGLDNRRENLRIANASQNGANRRKANGNYTSIYKGVRFHKGKYEAYIKTLGKQIYLGRFIAEIEAAKAYDIAATELFGSFALLNLEDGTRKNVDE